MNSSDELENFLLDWLFNAIKFPTERTGLCEGKMEGIKYTDSRPSLLMQMPEVFLHVINFLYKEKLGYMEWDIPKRGMDDRNSKQSYSILEYFLSHSIFK